MEIKDKMNTIRCRLPWGLSFGAVVFMLCVVPLFFHDAFFDINRCKVDLVVRLMPCIFAAMFPILVFSERNPLPRGRESALSYLFLALFLLSCVISCARTGFESAVLKGNEGRYAGLYFMLACSCAFFVPAVCGVPSDAWLWPPVLAGLVIAILGILNVFGIDPLGFYTRIKKGQEVVFLSTIGHYDFYGTVMVLIFGMAGGIVLFGRKRLFIPFALLTIAGAYAARTESVFIGLHLTSFTFLFLSFGDVRRLSTAFFLWGMVFLLCPLTVLFVTRFSSFSIRFGGIYPLLGKGPVPYVLAAVFFGLSCLAGKTGHSWTQQQGKQWGARLLLGGILLVLVLMITFTFFLPEQTLGGFEHFFRMDDNWGSRRGYIYARVLRAYGDYGPMEKLFGRGMELTKRITRPYIDNPQEELLSGGVYTDAHSQPLQLLITTGFLGAGGFVAFYLTVLVLLYRHCDGDAVLCTLLAAWLGYLVLLLVNVTQPILLVYFFTLSGMAMGRLREISEKSKKAEKDKEKTQHSD